MTQNKQTTPADFLSNESGFTLIESILAIGILSVVVVQLLSIQASTMQLTKTARDNIKSTWAMRQAVSQFEYYADVIGVKELKDFETKFAWSGDPDFQIQLRSKEVPVEASKLLTTGMKMGSAMNQQGSEAKAEDGTESLKAVFGMLDSQVPKDLYRSVSIVVSWKDGENTKSLEGGLVLIDDKSLQGLGNLAGMAAGALGGGGSLGGGGEGGGAGGVPSGGSPKPPTPPGTLP